MSKFKDGELVEVCMNDDRRWRQATFRQKTVEVYYWTQEPGEPPCGWDRIRKIDPNPAENPITNTQTHA